MGPNSLAASRARWLSWCACPSIYSRCSCSPLSRVVQLPSAIELEHYNVACSCSTFVHCRRFLFLFVLSTIVTCVSVFLFLKHFPFSSFRHSRTLSFLTLTCDFLLLVIETMFYVFSSGYVTIDTLIKTIHHSSQLFTNLGAIELKSEHHVKCGCTGVYFVFTTALMLSQQQHKRPLSGRPTIELDDIHARRYVRGQVGRRYSR